jgi:PAS domain S-box-containing protein
MTIDASLSRDDFRQLFQTSPDAILLVNGEGIVVLANEQVHSVFGYDNEELQGQPVEVLIPEEWRQSHHGKRRAYSNAPVLRPMGIGLELFGARKDNTRFPVEISLSPVNVEQGLFISVSIRDVSERKRLKADARRSLQYLGSAIDSIEGSFLIWDADGRLVLCNTAASRHLGEGHHQGKTWPEVMNGFWPAEALDLQRVPADFSDLRLDAHGTRSADMTVSKLDGSTLRCLIRPTPEGGAVMWITDVTESVKRQAEVTQARADAEAASAAKSEFLSAMSHELRTPLNAILGFSQLLQRDSKTPLNAKHQERLYHILRNGEHLLHLVDDVLDLARIEARRLPITIEAVGVNSVLQEVRRTLAPAADEFSVSLAISHHAACFVVADRSRLRQILMNFASNAIKYGKLGGNATLAVSLRGERARIGVTDDGIGIPLAKQAKLFEPFQRAGQEAGPIPGTGIGLAICKQLAELMAGSVGFRSQEGVGSEFWVDLPLAANPELTPPKRDERLDRNKTSDEVVRRCVVYVEDNPSSAALMEDLLSEEPVELIVAPSAELGLQLIRARKPRVVIMDINLPGMSGIEAQSQLMAWPETATIPVIALSAAAMPGEAQTIAAAGFHSYLTKPVKVNDLLDTLHKLL